MAPIPDWLGRSFDELTDAVVLCDAASPERISYVNRAFTLASGYTIAEAIGRSLDELQGEPRTTSGTREVGEATVRRRDGSEYVVERRRCPLGEVTGASLVIEVQRDLTELRRTHAAAERLAGAEEALRQSEEKYRLLVEGSRDIISCVDAAGRMLYMSPAVHDVLGYRPEELVGRASIDLLPDDERAPQRAAFAAGVSEGAAPSVTTRVRRKDGTYAWVEYYSRILRDAQGGVAGYQSIGRDVTARLVAEEALRRSQDAFVSLVEAIPDPIVLHRNGTAVLVNRGFVSLLGYERREDLLGRSLLSFVHPDDLAYVCELLGTPHSDRRGNITAEHRIVRRDESAVPIEVISVPIVHEGQVTSLAYVRDLRERKRVEAQLMLADRMASLGRLSAAIGHEINNPLAYVVGALELMARELDIFAQHDPTPAGRLVSLLTVVRDGTERVRTIVADMKALSRVGADEHGPVNVVRVLDQCAAMASHEIRHRARLVKRYAAVPPVHGNEARLGQVFLNLLVNASEAIAEGDVDGNEVAIETRPAADGSVIVEIHDTGAGIVPEIRERIFEPFFTTKGSRAGTGLGLSISHHIVTALGGSISTEPRTPRGTCVRVTLRSSYEAPCAVEREQMAYAAPTGGRVLVVDDEPLLVRVVTVALEGNHVTPAGSGREALDIIRSGAGFDAIVCDLHMDGMSGMDLYEVVANEFPDLGRRMVFMTGGALSDRARAFVESSGCTILNKPFTRAALGAAVRGVLEGVPA